MATMQAIPDSKDVTQQVESVERVETQGTEARVDALVSKTPKRKWVSYIWDSLDKSPEERRLVLKLDCALLTFASLGGHHNNSLPVDFVLLIMIQATSSNISIRPISTMRLCLEC
jgi:hypothetical protein